MGGGRGSLIFHPPHLTPPSSYTSMDWIIWKNEKRIFFRIWRRIVRSNRWDVNCPNPKCPTVRSHRRRRQKRSVHFDLFKMISKKSKTWKYFIERRNYDWKSKKMEKDQFGRFRAEIVFQTREEIVVNSYFCNKHVIWD